MKYITVILMLIFNQGYSQTSCYNENYIDEISNLNMGPSNTLLVLKLKNSENKTRRYLISSKDFSQLIHINYYIDTSFASIVRKTLLEENINFSIDSSKLKNYLIPENLYAKNKRKNPCSVYKKTFNKKGFPKKGPIYYYNWGEHTARLAYLIDNYSIIIVDDLLGVFAYRKPCCSGH